MGKFVRLRHEDARPAYDLFVSTPMSAYAADEKAYKENRETLMGLFQDLREKSRFSKFFCPALLFDDLSSFHGEHDALSEDFRALESSQAFLLYYMPPLPTKPSSVFVEAGMALAARIPSVYVVRSRLDLPYMLRSADTLVVDEPSRRRWTGAKGLAPRDPFVKIVELGDGEALDASGIARWLDRKLRSPLKASLV